MSITSSSAPEIDDLVARYHAWLRDRTVLKKIGRWTEITTPFLDRHNDCIQIYAQQDQAGLMLTDDAYTLNDLEMSGCSLDSPKRREMLRTTLNGFGVRLVEGALQVSATADNFAIRKHNLIQAISRVNRVFRDKPHGLLVDSIGIGDDNFQCTRIFNNRHLDHTHRDTAKA